MVGRQGEQGAGAGRAAVVGARPTGQSLDQGGVQGGVVGATILPREEVEYGVPVRVMGLALGRVRRQGQIADRDLAPLVWSGCGAGGGAARIAEGVELFDEAQAEARLVGHEVAQSPFKRAVAHGIERAEGQGAGAVLGLGRQDHGPTVLQRHDDDRQADAHALIRRSRHAYSVCQASSAGRRPTALART